MTRAEWIRELRPEADPDEVIFRITRGCDRCGLYLPENEGREYRCMSKRNEALCREEHKEWLAGEMDS